MTARTLADLPADTWRTLSIDGRLISSVGVIDSTNDVVIKLDREPFSRVYPAHAQVSAQPRPRPRLRPR